MLKLIIISDKQAIEEKRVFVDYLPKIPGLSVEKLTDCLLIS
jgi:hypothetical protein